MSVSQFSKQIAKGTFWSLSGNMVLKLISFFYLVMLTRMASQTDVGLFYSALGFFGIILIFSDAGLRGSLIRYVPFFLGKEENEKIDKLLKIAYLISGILSLSIGLLIFFGSEIISDFLNNTNLSSTLKLLSPYLLLYTLFILNTSFLNGLKNMRDQSILLVFQNASKFVITLILFFFLGSNLFSISVGFLASFFVALILSFLYVKKPLKELSATVKMTTVDYSSLLCEVIPFGMMMSLITSFWLIVNHTDRLMILYFVGAEQVAIYTAATSLAMLIMIFPTAIGAIFFPVVSELFGKGKKDEMISAGSTSLRWMLFIIIPLVLVLLVFPERLLDMFYGKDYAVGGFVLAIFTVGLLIRSMSIMHSLALAGMRLITIELKVATVAAGSNVLFNLLLIPSFGIEGAAISSAVALTIATILFVFYSKKMLGFTFPMESLKAVLAGSISLALIFLARPYLSGMISMLSEFGAELASIIRLAVFGILFLVAGLVYLVTLFLLRTFTQEDVDLLGAALRKARIPEKWIETVSKIASMGIAQSL